MEPTTMKAVKLRCDIPCIRTKTYRGWEGEDMIIDPYKEVVTRMQQLRSDITLYRHTNSSLFRFCALKTPFRTACLNGSCSLGGSLSHLYAALTASFNACTRWLLGQFSDCSEFNNTNTNWSRCVHKLDEETNKLADLGLAGFLVSHGRETWPLGGLQLPAVKSQV